jgi:hypothetical protein
MVRNISRLVCAAVTLTAIVLPIGRGAAQSVVTGTTPEPQVVTGTTPEPQVILTILLSIVPSA